MRFGGIIWLSFFMLPAGAAEPGLEEIVNAHLDALGGKEKISAVKTLKLTGTYAYNGLEHTLAVYRKRPAKTRFDIEGLEMYGTSVSPGKKVVRAYDGSAAWGMGENPKASGAYDLPGTQAEIMAQRADFDGPLVDYLAKGNQLQLLGTADVDGTDSWHLEVTLANGKKEEWFLHKKTYLPIKLVIKTGGQDFTKPLVWFFDDWREVEGIMLPFFVHVEELLFSREYLIEAVEVNPELPDSLFAKPAE